MTDRRRLNPPPGGTVSPPFSSIPTPRPTRTRPASEPRRIYLQTGIVPSASGSSYYEIQPSDTSTRRASFISPASSVKLTCTVHGPRPLPRNSAYSSTMVLNTHVKFAPFATRERRGYVRDAVERDLGAHLETALGGVVIGERFPKSACDVIITVLEGEDDEWIGEKGTAKSKGGGVGGVGNMIVLAGCITAASAALVDAGIDCVDLVAGGVSGIAGREILVDPCPSEHETLSSACVVGYLESRDEITELWTKGNIGTHAEGLIDQAVEAAQLSRVVLSSVVREVVTKQFEEETPVNGVPKGAG